MKTLLLDFEGTLAFYEKKPDPVKAAALARKLGYEVYHQEWEAARRLVFFTDAKKTYSWEEFIAQVFARLHIKAKKSDITKVADYYRKNTVFRFFDDAETLRKIPARKIIVTTTPRFYFDELDTTDFEIFTSAETGVAKGNPEFFLRVLRKAGVKAADALVVGNEMDCDIMPAKEAGIRTLLINRNGGGDIASLMELRKFL